MIDTAIKITWEPRASGDQIVIQETTTGLMNEKCEWGPLPADKYEFFLEERKRFFSELVEKLSKR